MTFAPYPSTQGTSLQVLEVTDDTIVIRHPDDGRTKTIARPSDYDPIKGRVAVAATPKKPARTLESTWSTTICPGMWTVTRFSDGTCTAALTERWETPLKLSDLKTIGQRAAQRDYDASKAR